MSTENITTPTKHELKDVKLSASAAGKHSFVKIEGDGLKIVAQTYTGCDTDVYEAQAYAHLFAAAPDLLRALLYIVNWNAEKWSAETARDLALEAIAKADRSAERQITALVRFAREYAIPVSEAEKLCKLAKQAKEAEEAALSYNKPAFRVAADKAAATFENKAADLGFGVSWPGLWPVLHRPGNEFIELP